MDPSTVLMIKKNFNEARKEYARGAFSKALEKFMSIFSLYREQGDTEGMGDILYHVAMTQKKLGQFQDAILNFKEALELYRFFKKDDKIAMVLHALGVLYSELGELDVAWRYLEDASNLYSGIQDKKGLAAVIHEVGNINLRKNNVDDAEENFTHALEFFNELGDEIGIGSCQYGLALVALKREDLDGAREKMNKAREIFKENEFLDGLASLAMLEGLLFLKEKDYNNADKAFNNCLRLIAEKYFKSPDRTGMLDKTEEVQVLINMGNLFLQDSEMNLPDIGETINVKAYQYFNEAAELSSRINYKKGICQARFNIGLLLHKRGSYDDLQESSAQLSNALEIAKELKDNEMVTRCLLLLGINHRKVFDFERSLTYLQDCIAFTRRMQYRYLESRALIEKHKVLVQVGDLEGAGEILSKIEPLVRDHPDYRRLKAELVYLEGELARLAGDTYTAMEKFEESKEIYQDLFDKKGIITVLRGIIALNEEQGFFAHAINLADQVISISQGINNFQEEFKARNVKARLMHLNGQLDEAIIFVNKTIESLEKLNFLGSWDLMVEAKYILYELLNEGNHLFDAEAVFSELIEHYKQNGKLVDLFWLFIKTAYESISTGKGLSIRPIVKRLWKLLNNTSNVDFGDGLLDFLHILGIMEELKGNLDAAKKYYNECFSLIQKGKHEERQGIIMAQLAGISYIMHKEETLPLYLGALASVKPEEDMLTFIDLNSRIGELYLEKGELDKALTHLMDAVLGWEDLAIVKRGNIYKRDDFHLYITRTGNVYEQLSKVYFLKYLEDPEPQFLERAYIAMSFYKIRQFHDTFFKNLPLKIFSVGKSIMKHVDRDEVLTRQANVKYHTMMFYIQRKAYFRRLLAGRVLENQDYLKNSMEKMNEKIKETAKEFRELAMEIKKNRVKIMGGREPGVFVPFLGYDLLKATRPFFDKHPGSILLDYCIYDSISKLAIFVVDNTGVDVVIVDINHEFFEFLEKIHESRIAEDYHDVVFLHARLTGYLLPKVLLNRLARQGPATVLVSLDPLISEINFNMLGEENKAGAKFSFLTIPHVHSLRLLDSSVTAKKRRSAGSGNDNELDFYFIHPDIDDPHVLDELQELTKFFEQKVQEKSVEPEKLLFLSDIQASYSNFKDIGNYNPRVITFSGTAFVPRTLPMKGFLTTRDRMFFLENILDIDLRRENGLCVISTNNDVDLDVTQALALWRLFSLMRFPNLLVCSSRHGFSGDLLSRFYDNILEGTPLGEAIRNAIEDLGKVQEVSPLTWGSVHVIGDPDWIYPGVMTGGLHPRNPAGDHPDQ